MQPDTIIPDLSNPQSWNRFSYVYNNPVLNNDPTGHCTAPGASIICGAAIGAIVGAALYLWSESKQADGIHMNDLGDLAAAAGMGATAGALIGAGAFGAGIGMMGSLLADHATNIYKGDNFSAGKHALSGAIGLGTGVVTAGAFPGNEFATPAETAILRGVTASTLVGGYYFLNHHKGIFGDPSSEGINTVTAGISESLGSGVANGLNSIIGQTLSEVTGGLTSAAIQTTGNIVQKPSIPTTPASTSRNLPICAGGRTCRGGWQE